MESQYLLQGALISASAVGVASHLLYYIHGEHHLQAPKIAVLHISAAFLLLSLIYYYLIPSLSVAAVASIAICMSYTISLFSSILIYRFFLHRLKRFPGPPGLVASKLGQVWKIRRLDQYRYLDSLRKRYGDFVRTGRHSASNFPEVLSDSVLGPEELTIFHPDAFKAIHGAGTKTTKPAFYDVTAPLESVFSTRSIQKHDLRRKLIDQGFSKLGNNILIFINDAF